MEPRTIIRTAALAAIPVEMMLRAHPLGVNVPLAAIAIGAALLTVDRRDGATFRMRLVLALTLVALASITAIHAESMLWLAVAFAMVTTLAMMALPDVRRLGAGEPIASVLRGVRALLHSASGPLRLLHGEADWRRAPRAGGTRTHVRGLAWSIPVVLPFLLLFAQADPVFSSLVTDLIDVPRFLTHVVLWSVFAWLGTGWLASALVPWGDVPEVRSPIGAKETIWVLGALAFVFDVFVALQVRWFFGGDALPRYMSGLTYAEYARRGFFELLTVGALLLGVVLLADWATRDAERAERRQVRLLSGLLLGLLGVVLTSALLRMRLYIDVYGLTQDRFFATAFMFWLVVVFVWFAATILRGRRDVFIPGVYVSGVLAVLALGAIDPIARIAEFNVERARETGKFDPAYALELGDDAVPVLAAALNDLPADARCALHGGLVADDVRDDDADWRSANLSRARAARIRQEIRLPAACPYIPTGASR